MRGFLATDYRIGLAVIPVFGAETLRVQTLFGQPAHHDADLTMGHEYPFRAGGDYRSLQAGPVSVIGQHEPAVHTAPAARTAQLHPAAREGVGVVTEALHPTRALRRRGSQDNALSQHRGVGQFTCVARLRKLHPRGAVYRIQRLYCAVHEDGPDVAVQPRKHALRLTEGVAEKHAGAPGCGVDAPPGIDIGEDIGLRLPAVDGQAKSRFGDKTVAAHRLERRTRAIGFQFVVARCHPYSAFVLEAHLR